MLMADFLIARIERLYPLVLLGGLFSYLSAVATGLSPALTLSAAYTALGLPAPRDLAPAPFFLNGPVWSLFFEIIVNLVYAVLAPKLTDRRLVAVTAVSGVAWLALAFVGPGLGEAGTLHETLSFGVVRATFPFFAGVCLYRAHAAGRLPKLPGGFMPYVILCALIFALPKLPGWVDVLFIAIIFPAVIGAGAQAAEPGVVRRWGPLLGGMSYPIYVLHYPIYRMGDALIRGTGIPHALGFPLMVAGACAISYLALRYYDEPVREWLKVARRSRRKRHARRQGSAATVPKLSRDEHR
jgi:peptidoglycan/LPS O-acetylase OafA/YrhL